MTYTLPTWQHHDGDAVAKSVRSLGPAALRASLCRVHGCRLIRHLIRHLECLVPFDVPCRSRARILGRGVTYLGAHDITQHTSSCRPARVWAHVCYRHTSSCRPAYEHRRMACAWLASHAMCVIARGRDWTLATMLAASAPGVSTGAEIYRRSHSSCMPWAPMWVGGSVHVSWCVGRRTCIL